MPSIDLKLFNFFRGGKEELESSVDTLESAVDTLEDTVDTLGDSVNTLEDNVGNIIVVALGTASTVNGQDTVTITNSSITSSDICFAISFDDSLYVISAACSTGSATVTLSGNGTGAESIGYLIVRAVS